MDQIDRDSDDVGDTTERDPAHEPVGGDGAPAAQEAAAELGTHRYLLAAFFALGLIGTYVLSRALGATWASLANRDWFVRALPRMAAADDETQGLWSTALASLVVLVALVRTYRRPSVKAWAEGVVLELAKCVWPTRRDVTNYTTVVIVVSLVCTAYLTVLDRLYAFVTGLVYGGGT